MSVEIQRRRGTAAEHTTFTGAAGELTVNTTNKTIHVHDGSTVGGFETAKASDLATKLPLSGGTITGALDVTGNIGTLGDLSVDYEIDLGNSSNGHSYITQSQYGLSINSNSDVEVLSTGNILLQANFANGNIVAQGKVGIGTTIVNDRFVVASNSAAEGITLRGDSFDAFKINMVNPGVDNNINLNVAIANSLLFSTNNTERMRIEDTGNVKFSNSYQETVYAITGTSPAINPVNGTIQTWTVAALSSPTISMDSGQSFTLMVVDPTSAGINWPVINWVGGNAPTIATTGYTVMTIWKVGTTLYGSTGGDVA